MLRPRHLPKHRYSGRGRFTGAGYHRRDAGISEHLRVGSLVDRDVHRSLFAHEQRRPLV